MIIETHHIEMHILNTVFFKNSLRSDQLTQIEVVQEACFS
jgi:hypothetical protein